MACHWRSNRESPICRVRSRQRDFDWHALGLKKPSATRRQNGPGNESLTNEAQYKNVIDYELLPYHGFGLGKHESLGVVYELDDYKTPSDELVQRLQAIIDEAFGRSG